MTTFSTPTDFSSIAALIQNDLSQIGITVNIVPQDPATFGANNSAGAFDWDLTGARHARRRRRVCGRVQPERRRLRHLVHGLARRTRGATRSRSGASSATAGSSSTTTKRLPMYQTLGKDLMDEVVEIPLISVSKFFVVQKHAEEHVRRLHRLQPGPPHRLPGELGPSSAIVGRGRLAGSTPRLFAPVHAHAALRRPEIRRARRHARRGLDDHLHSRAASAREHPRPLLRRRQHGDTRARSPRPRRSSASPAPTRPVPALGQRRGPRRLRATRCSRSSPSRGSCRAAIPIDIELILLAVVVRDARRDPARRDLGGQARQGRRLHLAGHGAHRHQHPQLLARDAAPVFTSRVFHWVPPLSYVSFFRHPWQNLREFLLPAFAISLFTLAVVMRMVRATMLEVLRLDYVRTARAKGCPPPPGARPARAP